MNPIFEIFYNLYTNSFTSIDDVPKLKENIPLTFDGIANANILDNKEKLKLDELKLKNDDIFWENMLCMILFVPYIRRRLNYYL
jgi:hypothetical protein